MTNMPKRYTILKRAALSVLIAIPAIMAWGIIWGFVSTKRRMADFRSHIVSGMSTTELVRFAGKPTAIGHDGEPLVARRTFVAPRLDDHTAIYAYAKEGLPYFNVYVFVDESKSSVKQCIVENLWW